VVAQKIVDVLSVPFVIKEQDLSIGASIGIALYPQDGADVEILLKNSDTAMYQAKGAGRSNYQFFMHTMNTSVDSRADKS
jgi:diguanylate cyclase (GGDEF)-like protein